MSPLLLIAVILFTIAMFLYSFGIWSERRARRLKKWHVYMFGAGVCVDVLATILTFIVVGGIVWTPHAIMGFVALILMAIHFIWAIVVIQGEREHALTHFHKLSLIVWSVWMFSYLSGMVLGMGKI